MPKIEQVLKANPIVVDSEGWIIDGNHRAMAAAEAGLTSVPALVPAVVKDGVAEGKITLSTDPNWYGATVDNYQASGPVVNIPANQLVGFEPDDKMNQPKSKVNVEKIVAGLKQGAKLPPLLVRKYKKGYQVLDGHHRFWAYKSLGIKTIPVQIVPDSDIEEKGKQDVAEGLLKEFAPSGQGGGDSGRWYTDDELADIIGDDWLEDFDVSHDEFNIDAYGEKAKQNLASYANSWFDDKGYNVNVMGVDHNEVDHNLKWYIVGSFHNPRFANEGMAEASLATMRDYFAGDKNAQSADKNSRQRTIQKVFRSPGEYTQWAKQNKIVNAPRINEEPEFFSTPLRMSEYRGKHHPATNEPYDAKFKFSGDLKDRVHGLLDAGTKPTLLQVNPRHLLATQDWLSTQGGGKPPFATMKQHPVVLQKNNKLYILDGHHRSADALDSGTPIEVYLFRDEL